MSTTRTPVPPPLPARAKSIPPQSTTRGIELAERKPSMGPPPPPPLARAQTWEPPRAAGTPAPSPVRHAPAPAPSSIPAAPTSPIPAPPATAGMDEFESIGETVVIPAAAALQAQTSPPPVAIVAPAQGAVAQAAPAAAPNPIAPGPVGARPDPARIQPLQPGPVLAASGAFVPAQPLPVTPTLRSNAPSIAPIAYEAQAMASLRAPPRKSRGMLLVAALGVVGAVGLLGLGAVGFGVYKYRQAQAELERETIAQLQQASQQDKAAATPANVANTQEDDAVAAPPAPPSRPVSFGSPAVAATPKPATTAAAPAAPKASASARPTQPQGKGTLRTFSAAAGKPILVDGKHVGVAGKPLEVQCGPHSIQVGSGPARTVDVPCNGTVTVGSPDGT